MKYNLRMTKARLERMKRDEKVTPTPRMVLRSGRVI